MKKLECLDAARARFEQMRAVVQAANFKRAIVGNDGAKLFERIECGSPEESFRLTYSLDMNPPRIGENAAGNDVDCAMVFFSRVVGMSEMGIILRFYGLGGKWVGSSYAHLADPEVCHPHAVAAQLAERLRLTENERILSEEEAKGAMTVMVDWFKTNACRGC